MPIKNIDATTLKKWLENKEAIVIDVRESAEHEAEKIAESKLIPLGQISKDLLPNSDGKKLVIHCRSGGRSSRACQKLLNEDPDLELYNLEGGISAWAAIGNQTKNSNKFFLSLDRQVQLTIGLGTLAGSLLGYFSNPLFFLLPAFFGAGLTFAGLSGHCGLALLIAKMPWNQSKTESVSYCSFNKK